jgi:hypothetical protein
MNRASGRGTERPGAFALAPGGDIRRCADDHGHFERGTGVATPNGRRYFLDFLVIVTRRRHLAMAHIGSGVSRCWHVAARGPKKKPRRLISPRGSFRRVLSGQSLKGDASARAGRSLIRRNFPVEQ